MHNGLAGFHEMKRDLAMAVDPHLFADIEGSTDSEMFFFLALTFGLRDDPRRRSPPAVGLIEEVGHAHGIELPGADDGGHHRRGHHVGVPVLQRGRSRSLFQSTDVSTLRSQYPDHPSCTTLRRRPPRGVRAPGDLQGAWREILEASIMVQPMTRCPSSSIGPACCRSGPSLLRQVKSDSCLDDIATFRLNAWW